MASKTDVDRLMKNLFGSVLQLAYMKIPCVTAVYARGRLHTFGTKQSQENFELMEKCLCPCSCQDKVSMLEAFLTEQVDMINLNDDMFDNSAIDIHGILRYIENTKDAQKLPANLRLKRQLVLVIKKQPIQNCLPPLKKKIRKGESRHIKYTNRILNMKLLR